MIRACSLCLAPAVAHYPVSRCLGCLLGARPVATIVDLPAGAVAVLYDADGKLWAHDGERVIGLAPEERHAAQRALAIAERVERRARA